MATKPCELHLQYYDSTPGKDISKKENAHRSGRICTCVTIILSILAVAAGVAAGVYLDQQFKVADMVISIFSEKPSMAASDCTAPVYKKLFYDAAVDAFQYFKTNTVTENREWNRMNGEPGMTDLEESGLAWSGLMAKEGDSMHIRVLVRYKNLSPNVVMDAFYTPALIRKWDPRTTHFEILEPGVEADNITRIFPGTVENPQVRYEMKAVPVLGDEDVVLFIATEIFSYKGTTFHSMCARGAEGRSVSKRPLADNHRRVYQRQLCTVLWQDGEDSMVFTKMIEYDVKLHINLLLGLIPKFMVKGVQMFQRTSMEWKTNRPQSSYNIFGDSRPRIDVTTYDDRSAEDEYQKCLATDPNSRNAGTKRTIKDSAIEVFSNLSSAAFDAIGAEHTLSRADEDAAEHYEYETLD